MIEAIFFDFNGVIIDDEPLQLKVYQEILHRHGIRLTEEQYYGALGMDDQLLVRTIFERERKPHTEETLQLVIERKSELRRELIGDKLPLFPGVVTFVKATSRRYSLGLVSMARRIEIDYVLDHARLRSFFSVIVSAEDVKVCKPAPDCFRLALEKLNEKRQTSRLLPVLNEECLVIEDAPPGVEAGVAAGMRTMAVTNTVSEEVLRKAGAEVVTASLADWTVDAVHQLFD
jgi:HAD superfamily hydrolase (TIGR01509 family)